MAAQQSATSNATALHQELVKKLEWMPDAWIAIQEACLLALGIVMVDIEERNPDDLDIPQSLTDLKGVEYFEVSYAAEDDVEEPLAENNISVEELHETLVKAELLRRSCTRATYVFRDIMHELVRSGTQPDVQSIDWKRMNIDPPLVTFQSGTTIQPLNHDYLEINCGGNVKFVADIAGEQFGFGEWFFTSTEYQQYIVEGRLEPPQPGAEEVRQLDQNVELRKIKSVIDECYFDAEFDWLGERVNWTEIHLCPDAQRRQLYKVVVDAIRDKAIEVFKETSYRTTS